MNTAVADDVDDALLTTSRTFYLPIRQLPPGLCEAVSSAYLCLRAIDEIEDHPGLPTVDKARALRAVAQAFQAAVTPAAIDTALQPYEGVLPEVTRQLSRWAYYSPSSVAARIWEATAVMASRMAEWAERDWRIATPDDLDQYTFAVAGSVGLLLSDLWSWFNGTDTDRTAAVEYGRTLQAVNIRKDLHVDANRGVTFLPAGWTADDLDIYIDQKMIHADRYLKSLPAGPIRVFSAIPYELARATAVALRNGKDKLGRHEVEAIVARCTA
ncbi:All-trans-phytoene synthase (plasmid) [Streptomyces sp. YIM 121038]|uniref:squalene/phytoene synthase family protein n=1 Tax=Streptomyces sp. YIM 121038 TaxID=2136401 RepID=UPI001110E41D|nr:squalene/phytoene synthase family protein [Streptomyces sp. YIM 121038]QCX82617.1 All-trans-phytoene synthase [Streptomyces sp. YIM 121038]